MHYTFVELNKMANYLGCAANIDEILREGSHLMAIDTFDMSYKFFCKCEHLKEGSKNSRLLWIQAHMRSDRHR